MKRIKPFLWVVLFNLSLFCGPALYAQYQFNCTNNNLVPNPGFEDHTGCPDNFSELNLAPPWFQPTGGTPDYYNACGLVWWGFSVPNNWMGGTLPAHGGQAYAGAYMYLSEFEYREYLAVPLLYPLSAGHIYTVSFYVSLSSESTYAVDNMGAYFSKYPVISGDDTNLVVTPQVQNPAGLFLDSANWTLVQLQFTAQGGESYLTIGNFYDNAHTPLETLSNGPFEAAYYFFDDVSVTDATPCNTCSNDCITISDPGDILVATCSNSLPVFYSVGVTDGCCSAYSLKTVPASGFIFPLGTTMVTNTVTDSCGHSNYCTFTVTVIQETNPPIVYDCPTNIILCATNGCTAMPDLTSEVLAVSATGGTNVVVTQSIPPGTVICSDANVIFTVTDACGDATNCTVPCILINCSSNCLQIQCWTNIVVTSCTNLPVYYDPTVTDSCCSNLLSYCTPNSGSIFDVGTTQTVVFVAMDDCGNTDSCSFTVTVEPGTNCTNCLQIQCPSNIVVTTCSNCAVVNFAATVLAPCCSNGLNVTYSPKPGSCFPVGINTVAVTATNECGEIATCNFTVTVNQSNCPPVIAVGPTNFFLCAGPGGCATMPDEVHDASPIHYALYNTAVASGFSTQPLPPGTLIDPHWTLASVPNLPPASPLEFGTNVELQANAVPEWLAADNLSGWIGPANDANNDGPEGDYDYRTTFILSGDTPVSILGQLAADDSVVEILLNGEPTGVSVTNDLTSAQWNAFTLAGAGLAGTNTLDFIVHNNPLIGTNPPADNRDTPTGLIAEFNTVETQLPFIIPAAVQATNCDGTPAAGWQSIPAGTVLCADTNITFVFTNACGDTTSYAATITVAPCCVAPPPRMVLWLTFDETVGITCLNSAGYNNGYRYEGNNYANHLNGPTHNIGQYVNNSLSFDGSDDKVVVPNYSAIDFNTNNFSMDAWVKWDGGPAPETLLDHRIGSVIHPVGYQWFINAGKPGVQLDNGNINSFTAAKAIPSNVWTHLAATVQRGSTSGLILYTNGAPSDSFNIATVNGSIFNQMDLWVGAPQFPVNNLFEGSLDEIELFNEALPAYEFTDIYDAGRAGKCRPTCSVPTVTSVCIGATKATVSVQICNCGSSAMTFDVSFNGLTAAQAGGSPATNGPTGFGNYPSSVTLPPDDCTNFTVNITIPSYLSPAKVMYYQMVIQDGLGQQFSSIGEIVDPLTIYSASCFSYVTPINPNTGTLIWTKSTNVVFVINNPTNVPINLTSTVVVLDANLQPETNLVSLNNLSPGTMVTNQLPFAPHESLLVGVNVNYLDSAPWTPFYLVLMLNVGDGGAFIPVASATFAQVTPPTVGPPLTASATNGQVIISWDIVNRGWTLRSAANVGGTNWIPVNLPVLPLPDGSQGITSPATNRAQFFQLIGPNPP